MGIGRRWVWIVALLAPAWAGAAPADMVLFNGKVLTVDKAFSIEKAVAIKDGKIIAVGGDGGNFVAARFNTDGTLDTSFGSSGIKSIDFGGWDYANAVALQSDGEIVMGGATGLTTPTRGERQR